MKNIGGEKKVEQWVSGSVDVREVTYTWMTGQERAISTEGIAVLIGHYKRQIWRTERDRARSVEDSRLLSVQRRILKILKAEQKRRITQLQLL
jgi:hypothetical protein